MRKSLKKILIIRFSSIGDIVLTSPIIRCLKKQLLCEVHFLTKKTYYSLIKPNPYIDKIWTIEEGLKSIKSENYDLIIDLHKNLRSSLYKLIIGKKSITFDKRNIRKWWKVNIQKNFAIGPHLVERYFESLQKIGVVNDGQGLDFFIDHHQVGLDVDNLPLSYSCIVLGASYATKRIPVSLAIKILQKNNDPFIILGGKDVIEEGESLKKLFPNRVIDLSGRLNLHESAAIIAKANTIHTGDTGLMHIATALNKTIEIYWGSTVPEFGMGPYPINPKLRVTHHEVKGLKCRPCSKLGQKKCPEGHFNCMLKQQL